MMPPSDEEQLREMMAHARRRTRRFWFWMGFPGGIPWLVLGLGLASALQSDALRWVLSFVPLLLWSGFCARNILRTVKGLSFDGRMGALLPLAVLLAALNAVLVVGIVGVACAIIMGGRLSH